jgi:hypothetical protein
VSASGQAWGVEDVYAAIDYALPVLFGAALNEQRPEREREACAVAMRHLEQAKRRLALIAAPAGEPPRG